MEAMSPKLTGLIQSPLFNSNSTHLGCCSWPLKSFLNPSPKFLQGRERGHLASPTITDGPLQTVGFLYQLGGPITQVAGSEAQTPRFWSA